MARGGIAVKKADTILGELNQLHQAIQSLLRNLV
jgi:hypothetical protein